jgi:hypothetical protein
MRSPRDWIAGAPPAALAAALAAVVIGAGLFGFAIAELTSDDSSTTANTQAPAVVGGSTQDTGAVPTWPRGLVAHTVIIRRAPDRPAALAAAKEARRAGLDAGLIEAAPYGLRRRGTNDDWLVFVGSFATRGGALKLAKRLAVRYPGASVELVQSSQ